MVLILAMYRKGPARYLDTPNLMTLRGLGIDEIVKNIDLYRDKLHVLPQELQEEVNRRLAQQ